MASPKALLTQTHAKLSLKHPTPSPVQLVPPSRPLKGPTSAHRPLVAVAAAANTNDDHQGRGMFGMPLPPIFMSAFVGSQPKANTQQSSATRSSGDHVAAAMEHTMSRASSPQPVMAYSDRPAAGAVGGGGGGGGGGMGPGGDGAGMISVVELDSMLAGLKNSLQSIQASRAEYVELLSQRDAAISTLEQQLAEKERQAAELESQLRAVQALLEASRRPTPPASGRGKTPGREARGASPAAQVPRPSTPPPPPPQAAAPPAPPPPRPAAPPQEVTLTYRTGWKQAYVHCNMDGKGWTVAPGIPMEPVGGDMKQARIPCARLEFVITNGKGDWDSPPGNYHIPSPGNYRLEFGKVNKV